MTKEDGTTEEVLAVVASKYGGQEDGLLVQRLDAFSREMSSQQMQVSYFSDDGYSCALLGRLLLHTSRDNKLTFGAKHGLERLRLARICSIGAS